ASRFSGFGDSVNQRMSATCVIDEMHDVVDTMFAPDANQTRGETPFMATYALATSYGSIATAQTTERDDMALIREAQRGNTAAFEELVRHYDQPVLRLAFHLTRSENDAQDIYQDAFLRAYRNLDSFRFECSFYT